MLRRVADVAEEAVAPVVERVAEPRSPRDRLELLGARVEAEVAAEDIDARHRPRGPAWRIFAPVTRPGAIDPVVEAPLEVVHHRLDVVLAEPGEDPALHVGPVIAVGVAGSTRCRASRRRTRPPSRRRCRSARKACRRRRGSRRTCRRRRVSISSRTQPIGGSPRVLGERLVVGRIPREDSRSSRRRRAVRPRRTPPRPGP